MSLTSPSKNFHLGIWEKTVTKRGYYFFLSMTETKMLKKSRREDMRTVIV